MVSPSNAENRDAGLRNSIHNFCASVYPKHDEDNTCHHTVQVAELPRHENTLRINCITAHPFETDASDH